MPSIAHRIFARVAASQARPVPSDASRYVRGSRAALDAVGRQMIMPSAVHVRETENAPVPSRWIHCSTGQARTILYFHGGAYVAGSGDSHLKLAARVCKASRARALFVDYRRPPEHPFPAAVDDAVAILEWAYEGGADPATTVLCGDSAGGGLSLATLLAARDRGVTLPAAATLISPWTDLTFAGASAQPGAVDDPYVSREHLAIAASLYAGDEPLDHLLISPLFADLSGLPPLLCHVGTREILYDDTTRLVAAARRDGVEIDVYEGNGLMHVWHFFAPLMPEANEAIASLGLWIQQRTPA